MLGDRPNSACSYRRVKSSFMLHCTAAHAVIFVMFEHQLWSSIAICVLVFFVKLISVRLAEPVLLSCEIVLLVMWLKFLAFRLIIIIFIVVVAVSCH